jgi:hypothetical protein
LLYHVNYFVEVAALLWAVFNVCTAQITDCGHGFSLMGRLALQFVEMISLCAHLFLYLTGRGHSKA